MPSCPIWLSRLRTCIGISVSLALFFGLNTGLYAQDMKPEQRLEAIRAALVEAAVKSNTRVSTTSWMDTRGALLELNRFSSEIKLRDLQIDQYKKTNSTEVVELAPKTLESVTALNCLAPRARSPIKHVMRVSLDLASNIAPANQYLAQKIGFAARQQAQQASAQTQHWRLMTDPPLSRTYERLIYGQGEEAVEWHLKLTIMPARVNLSTTDNPAFILQWKAQSSKSREIWFDDQHLVFGVSIPSAYGTPKLDIDTTLAIESTVGKMARELDRQLACDPQSLTVQKNEDGQLVLNAGRASGLQVGDQLVLADARVLPGRAIEAGALDAAVLVEVKSVSVFQAEIRQVAGKKQTFQGGWVAWPYIY